MAYLILTRSNQAKLVSKSFACTSQELKKEIEIYVGEKVAVINHYSLEAANILLNYINEAKGLDKECLKQSIFFGLTKERTQTMAHLCEVITEDMEYLCQDYMKSL